jgi:hypothetical protein
MLHGLFGAAGGPPGAAGRAPPHVVIAASSGNGRGCGLFGDKYRAYRREVAMPIPGLVRRRAGDGTEPAAVKPALIKP